MSFPDTSSLLPHTATAGWLLSFHSGRNRVRGPQAASFPYSHSKESLAGQETVMSIVWLLIKGREHAMYTCTRAGGGYFSGEKQRLLSAAKILLLGQIYSKGWSSLYSSIMPVPPHAQPSPYEGLRQTCRQWFPHETTRGNSQGSLKYRCTGPAPYQQNQTLRWDPGICVFVEALPVVWVQLA